MECSSKMKLIVILIIFVDLTLAHYPIRGCGARLLPRNFKQCHSRRDSINCIPFPQLINLNWDTAQFGLRVLIGQLICNFLPKENELPSQVYFIVYQKKKLARVVVASKMLKNPHKYVRRSARCIRFLIGGWATDCTIDPNDVPKEYNWLTYSAESLNCRTDCIVIIVYWGKISGNDYACLAGFMLKPLGELIGRVIMKLGDPSIVSLSGHSLGAHIGGFACRHVIRMGGRVKEMAAYDAAGPLIQDNECLWQVGLFECGMGKELAKRTISINTNPRELGTGNMNLAQVNILCNPPIYNQPGLTLTDPLYNHFFAGMLCAAMSAGTKCYATDYPGINLNHYDNCEIPPGTYKLYTDKCFPFCCYEESTCSSPSSSTSSSSSS
ncbi:uncharacterized protein LOC129570805 [Sitodiplosis mosellana]|uniref:uncharacterized protein LOC129570805 n=1 Tax=Sitodiplosis mosellana TaxID=263140 RepID=UPI0024445C32|nr:uncharacterized protein LOC129570805 [Sitodiplosis mosellana]